MAQPMATPMAQAGMADRWGASRTTDPKGAKPAKGAKGATIPEGADEVQRSLELLDSVLSEFDDLENGNLASGAAPGPPTGTTVLAGVPAVGPPQPTRSIRSMAGSGSGSGSGSGEGEGDLLISSSTPEEDSSPSLSLSLGGHQSEDDGYMSMNGRRNKLALNFRPHSNATATAALVAVRRSSADMLTAPEKPLPPPPAPEDAGDFPPPPEEAQRLISNLLPRVSPNNSVQRGFVGLSGSRSSSSIAPNRQQAQRLFLGSLPQTRKPTAGVGSPTEPRVTTATQTTLPMTRNQRPFGWETDALPPPVGVLPPPNRFASLPYDGQQAYKQQLQQPVWLPPRPVAEQQKRLSTGDEEHFSDDSLEDMPPPPPPPEALQAAVELQQAAAAAAAEAVAKRGSIAWEVPLDQDPVDPVPEVLTPGSTKVVGKRRRRPSGDTSSSSSLQNLQDDWPEPPREPTSPASSCHLGHGRDDEEQDLYADASFLPPSLSASDLSASGTYVIRKGRKKERKPMRNVDSLQYNKARLQLKYAESKRCNYTFDNIDMPTGEDDVDSAAAAEGYPLVRVVSLPSMAADGPDRPLPPVPEPEPDSRRLTGEQQQLQQQERIKLQEERLIQRLQGLAVTPEEDEPSSSLIFNDADHQDDSLEPISNIAFDGDDSYRDGPLSLIEEQAETGNETDDPSCRAASRASCRANGVANGHGKPSATAVAPVGGRLSSRELDEFAEIQNRKQLPLPPPAADDKKAAAPHPDYYNLNKERIAENCRMLETRENGNPTKELYRPRKSASSNDVFSDTKYFPEHAHGHSQSQSSTREREDRPSSRRSSTDRRRHHQNMAAEMSSMERWRTTHDMNHVQVVPVVEKVPTHSRNGSLGKDKSHTVTVEVNHQHDFGPLPPSPVDEFEEDEYSEIMHPSPGGHAVRASRPKADTLPEPFYQCREPLGSDPSGARYLNRPPEPPPHCRTPDARDPRDPMHSLKTRSMDAGFTRGFRNSSQSSAMRRESPSTAERRTLPNDLPGPSSHVRRRAFQKRSVSSPQESGLQTSCSLPETPIFARGCDIPRTPHRRAPDVPSGSMRAGTAAATSSAAAGTSTSRSGGMQTSSYRKMGASSGSGAGLGLGTGVSLDSGGLGQALVGAELLRLTGGPGRGWYPRHRTPRPASIEHLDRVAPWDGRDSRKPMTLPPNMTPKFFHRSPRDALRRVTSLLIRGKGGSSKEPKKDTLSPSGGGFGFEDVGEGSRQKRGFFKGLWKRSRGYSLDHQ